MPYVRIMNTGYQTASLGNLFGLSYVVMRKPEPIDTTTLNYNWQVWETNAFSIYTKETDEIDERSAQEAVAAVLRYLSRVGLLRYNYHSGYLSSVVQETEMANVLTPAGGIFRRFVEPGQEVEYGQKLDALLKTVFLVKKWTGRVPAGTLSVHIFFRFSRSWKAHALFSPAPQLQEAAPAARCRFRWNGGQRCIAAAACGS